MRKNRVDHNANSATPFLTTSTGAVVKVKEKEAGHKWLGCMLSAAGSKNAILDTDYHSQSASRALFCQQINFLSRNVSIRNKLKFLNAIVTQIASFGAEPDASTMQTWPNLISTFDV